MLKKILKIALNVVIFLILSLLQLYVFNNWYIFGARFNVIILFVIVQAMLNTLKVSIPVSFLVGLITDILFGYGEIKYLVICMVIAIVLESLKLLYKQDTSLSIAIYATAGLLVFEILTVIFNAINSGIVIGIFAYLFAVVKCIILNVPVAYGMYMIIERINEKLEK